MGGHRPGVSLARARAVRQPRAGAAYAGIGSRATPARVLALMESLGASFARAGWVLRTGASPGADAAFYRGASSARGAVELYLPWPGFEGELWRGAGARRVHLLASPSRAACVLAARVHPAWARLGRRERRLRARDVHQVLGGDLHSPARLVVCWTAGASLDGSGERAAEGTAQALRVAHQHGIPVFNLARAGELRRVYAAL